MATRNLLSQLNSVLSLVDIYCKTSPSNQHSYAIIKGSGKLTGTPKWECKYCKQIKKSS
jgi:hypothetical protein